MGHTHVLYTRMYKFTELVLDQFSKKAMLCFSTMVTKPPLLLISKYGLHQRETLCSSRLLTRVNPC